MTDGDDFDDGDDVGYIAEVWHFRAHKKSIRLMYRKQIHNRRHITSIHVEYMVPHTTHELISEQQATIFQ